MTREEALNILHNSSVYHPMYLDALNMAIEALEQQPCDDAISRQEVWDVMQELWGTSGELIDRLMDLPPVTPVEKVGRWEYIQYDGNPNIGNWHCSECNRIVCGAITAVNPVYSYKYCPECGAKMREVES